MLSSNDQFTVTGQLWQQGGGKQRGAQRGAALASAEAAPWRGESSGVSQYQVGSSISRWDFPL